MKKHGLLLCVFCWGFGTSAIVQSGPPDRARWGAIAAAGSSWGYAFDHATRAAAEAAARAPCDKAAGPAGPCAIRVSFDRACGALALGNFSEWGSAMAPTAAAAARVAMQQCDAQLPTQPCRVVASICSLP